MSLVHEALQKAEREKQRKAGEHPAPAATPAAAPPPAPRAMPVILPIALACMALLAVLATIWILTRHTPAPTPAPPPVTVIHPPPPEPTPLPAPVASADDPGFKLTGIMKDPDGKDCAVVNGRVVYEGQYVDGATVKKIERDRVTLDANGRTVVKRLY